MPAKRPQKAVSSRRPQPARSRSRAASKERGETSTGPRSSTRNASRARPSAQRRELFTRLLIEERKRLRQELTEMEQHQIKTEEKPIADVSGYDDDLVDVATETFEREKGLALETSVQGILEMVEEALRRMRRGTYGICDGCGRPIDENRLRAIPYTRLCIKCKEREERARSVAR